MQTSKHVQCLTFEDGLPVGLFSLTELSERYKAPQPTQPTEPVPTPEPEPAVEPAPIDVLSDMRPVGFIGGAVLYLIGYLNHYYFGQMPSENPKHIVFRGSNLPRNPDVRLTQSLAGIIISGGVTGNNGMDAPVGIPMPEGYTEEHYGGDGRQYYRKLLPGEQPIVDTNPVQTGPQADPGRDYILNNPDPAQPVVTD